MTALTLRLKTKTVEKQRGLISSIRMDKEVAPISVTTSIGTVLVDCDALSMTRMQDAIMVWDALDAETVDWTMADNSVKKVTKAELQELYDATYAARAVRAAKLHAYAAGLKAQLPVPDNSAFFQEASWVNL